MATAPPTAPVPSARRPAASSSSSTASRSCRSAATARTSSATASSAPRASRWRSCTPTPTGSALRLSAGADGSFREAELGRGLRRDRPAPAADPGRRPQRRRALPGQPERPQPLEHALRPGAAPRARHAQRLLGEHRRPVPKQMSSGADVRRPARRVAGSRPRPHRPPADPRRQPARLQRQPDDRAGRARTAAGDPAPGAGSSSSSTRAAAAPPSRPTSTTSSARAPTRCCCSRSCTCCSPRGSPHPGRLAELTDWHRDCPRAGGAVHARGGRGRVRDRRRGDPAAWRASSPPRRRAAVYGRIGTCTQEFGTLASWLVDVLNLLTGNLDREGGAMFPLGAAGHSNAAGAPGRGRGARFGRWHEPRARPGRGLRRAAGGLPGRGDRHAGRGPGPGADHDRRQPRRSPRPTAAALRRGARVARVHGRVDIYVNETTRHADVILPGAVAAARGRTTTWPSTSSRCATWPTTRRRCSSPRPTCPMSG